MKGFFDELIDIYKEVEKEIKEEAEKQKRLAQPFSKNEGHQNINKSQNKKMVNDKSIQRKVFKPSNMRVEGAESKDYKEFKTLREVNSNLENKATYMDRVDIKKSKLGDYSKQVDSLETNNAIKNNQNKDLTLDSSIEKNKLIQMKNKDELDKEVKQIINSLKSKDKIKNARRAFLYSEIFNRKKW